MTPISYMTPNGDFAASCQTADDKPHPGLIEAPDGGAYGMRWDGKSWGEDAEAQVRADAFMYGAPVPESVTDEQLIVAMGAEAWGRLVAAKAGLPFRLQVAIDRRKVWGRKDEVVGDLMQVFEWTDVDADNLFKAAAIIPLTGL